MYVLPLLFHLSHLSHASLRLFFSFTLTRAAPFSRRNKQFIPLNPRPMLQGLVNKDVIVRIKWGQEYSGRLVSVDSYMNIQLSGAEEKSPDGHDGGVLGQVLIR